MVRQRPLEKIVFDEESRRTFLAAFHNRKRVERQRRVAKKTAAEKECKRARRREQQARVRAAVRQYFPQEGEGEGCGRAGGDVQGEDVGDERVTVTIQPLFRK